ncbi:MAG: hypothetical protein WAL63_17735, partial [Solirubrobacteraceae bacterium]
MEPTSGAEASRSGKDETPAAQESTQGASAPEPTSTPSHGDELAAEAGDAAADADPPADEAPEPEAQTPAPKRRRRRRKVEE